MIREIELKYKFDHKQDYLSLLNALEGEHRIEMQVNSLFDTPDLKLKAEHIFLRVRQSNENLIFTCKAKPENIDKPSEMLSIHDEWERPINLNEAQNPVNLLAKDWPGESDNSKQTRLSLLRRVTQIIGHETPKLVGSFKNIRTHVPYQIGEHVLDFEFDQTDFGSRIDYELEVELPESLSPQLAQDEINKLFKKLNIKTSPSRGKAERLFNLNKTLGS